MIAKCMAILAVVAQINAYGCNQQCQPLTVSGSCSPNAHQMGMASSGFSGSGTVRNLVAKGKYPVALRNCGSGSEKQIPVTTSRVTTPVQEKPTVRLSCSIPAPRTVSHSCTCYKTIVRPRVHQQVISVPTVQRYIETSHKPVVENIQYEALPVNCGDNSNFGLQIVEAPAAGPFQSQQVVQIPQAQAIQVPQVQAIQVPQIQIPQVHTVEVPRVQVQAVEVPRVEVQTVQVPQVQTIQVPQIQAVQVPQSFSFGSCTPC